MIEEEGITYIARGVCLDPDNVMAPLQAAVSTWRIAAWPRAGRKVLTLVGREQRPASRTRELCANRQGFNLHADVRCEANDRQGIGQLCRYVTRPPIANRGSPSTATATSCSN